MGEPVQDSQDVIHKDEIPHYPGIVEHRCESTFVPIERAEVALRDEEPIPLRKNLALEGDRVCGSGARQADGTLVCARVRADAGVTVAMMVFCGRLPRDGGLVTGGIGKGVGFRLGFLYDGFGILLDRLNLRLLILFIDFGNGIYDRFLGFCQGRSSLHLVLSRDFINKTNDSFPGSFRDRKSVGNLGLCGVVCLGRVLSDHLGGFLRCLLVCMADSRL